MVMVPVRYVSALPPTAPRARGLVCRLDGLVFYRPYVAMREEQNRSAVINLYIGTERYPRRMVLAYREWDRDVWVFALDWLAPVLRAWKWWRGYARWFVERTMGRSWFLWHKQGELYSTYYLPSWEERFQRPPQFPRSLPWPEAADSIPGFGNAR